MVPIRCRVRTGLVPLPGSLFAAAYWPVLLKASLISNALTSRTLRKGANVLATDITTQSTDGRELPSGRRQATVINRVLMRRDCAISACPSPPPRALRHLPRQFNWFHQAPNGYNNGIMSARSSRPAGCTNDADYFISRLV